MSLFIQLCVQKFVLKQDSEDGGLSTKHKVEMFNGGSLVCIVSNSKQTEQWATVANPSSGSLDLRTTNWIPIMRTKIITNQVEILARLPCFRMATESIIWKHYSLKQSIRPTSQATTLKPDSILISMDDISEWCSNLTTTTFLSPANFHWSEIKDQNAPSNILDSKSNDSVELIPWAS